MRKSNRLIAMSAAVAAIALQIQTTPTLAGDDANVSQEGKELAFNRTKGNCLACHMIVGGDSPGNLGPPLIAMKARYTDKKKLRAQIWDATAANPESSMVPFGRHKILTEKEIDSLVEYIWSL